MANESGLGPRGGQAPRTAHGRERSVRSRAARSANPGSTPTSKGARNLTRPKLAAPPPSHDENPM